MTHPAEILYLQPEGGALGDVTLVSAWVRATDQTGMLMPPRLPLGALSLAAATVRAGYCVTLRDAQQLQRDGCAENAVTLIARAIEEPAPILGISCMSDLLPAVLLAVTELKSREPSVRIILGGPGPGPVAQELLAEWPAVDAVVVGEGEATFAALLDALRGGASLVEVNGVCARAGSVVVCAPRRPREQNIDRFLPLPLADLPRERYSPLFPIITARGCPYRCSFCSAASLWGERITRHSLPAILAQIAQVAAWGYRRLAIVDDTFVLNRKRVEELCSALADIAPGLTWHCNGRIDLQDAALLDTLVAGGCRSIFYGVESGSARVLGRIGKGFTPDQAETVALRSLSLMQTTLSFIWGFPFETWEDFEATRAFCDRLGTRSQLHYQFHLLTPYPDVPLYTEYADQLRFDPQIHSHVRHAHLPLTADEIVAIRHYPRLFPGFYHFATPDFERKARAAADWLALP